MVEAHSERFNAGAKLNVDLGDDRCRIQCAGSSNAQCRYSFSAKFYQTGGSHQGRVEVTRVSRLSLSVYSSTRTPSLKPLGSIDKMYPHHSNACQEQHSHASQQVVSAAAQKGDTVESGLADMREC